MFSNFNINHFFSNNQAGNYKLSTMTINHFYKLDQMPINNNQLSNCWHHGSSLLKKTKKENIFHLSRRIYFN